jgi:hypothetical protein
VPDPVLSAHCVGSGTRLHEHEQSMTEELQRAGDSVTDTRYFAASIVQVSTMC